MLPIVYDLIVAGMTISAMNSVVERLGVSSEPIEQKDITLLWIQNPIEKVARLNFLGSSIDTKSRLAFRIADFLPYWALHPVLEQKPVNDTMWPSTTVQTSNLMFNFRNGKLHLVMNTQTNIESVEHYREWAKMPSLINSNDAYRMATNWLARVDVDVAKLNEKYSVNVGQTFFYGDEGTNTNYPSSWGHVGTNKITLPLFYVTWNKGDYQAAKVGIFGPTKQFMGLTIGDPDQDEDASLCNHVYLMVTNVQKLLKITNVPLPMAATNQDLLRLISPKPHHDTNSVR